MCMPAICLLSVCRSRGVALLTDRGPRATLSRATFAAVATGRPPVAPRRCLNRAPPIRWIHLSGVRGLLPCPSHCRPCFGRGPSSGALHFVEGALELVFGSV